MKNLNFFGQFIGDLGIPIHSREFAKALSKQCNLNLIQIPIAKFEKEKVDKELHGLFGKIDFQHPSFTFWYPDVYDYFSTSNKKNLGYYIFEYTKIPKYFIKEINSLDGICTASKWGVQVLKDNGVKIPCYVVHAGVSDKFTPPYDGFRGSQFKFLHIGKAENRKGTEMLIRAFIKAFGEDGDNGNVALRLSIDNPHIPGFDSLKYIDSITTSSSVDCYGHVDNLKTIYNAHHCAVFPTKAEGIGLPIVEAMGCGLPVITSNKNGMSEYINKDNAIILEKTKKVPVYDPNFFPEAGLYGEWDSPTEEELIEKMRWVYQNYTEAQKIGDNAAKWIKENYTWDIAAKKFLEEVI